MQPELKKLIKKVSAPSKRVYATRNIYDDQNKRAVIYTRVSTKSQEDNTSLENQRKKCLDVAKKYDFVVVSEFGNTYESAKTMERKEFSLLESFIKNKKNNIAYVIFYDIDRFSRDYNGIVTIEEWRKQYRIRMISATNPSIPTTDFEFIGQQQSVLNSYQENLKRRDKTMAGMAEKLRSGIWIAKLPVGYTHIYQGKKSKIVTDENAKYIKKIFELRGNQLMEVPDIYRHLKTIGCNNILEKNIYKILTNKFYIGYYTHGLLDEGEVIKGKHDPIISTELFIKVNTVFQEKHRKVRHDYPQLCLKSFVKCDKCGRNLTAYYKKDKNKYYYKCGTQGCNFNKSSEKMEDAFIKLLQAIKLSSEEKDMVKAELLKMVGDFGADNELKKKKLKSKLEKLESDLKRVKTNRAKGEIDVDIFQTAKDEINSEISATEDELKKTDFKMSNFSEKIDAAVEMLDNIDVLWKNNSIDGRKRVQKALIKSPIAFDREKGQYRTFGLIDFVRSNAVLARVSEFSENKNPQQNTGDSPMVARTGVEPVIPP
jgi:site-specific DNA recombinase